MHEAFCGRRRRSLARQLAVETGEADGEGLERAHGVVVVQGEDVFSHTTELHDDVVGWRENRS